MNAPDREWLAARGHDVISAFHALRGAADEVLLARAVAENRILITNDRDFGELIFRGGRAHQGVIFLRLSDERPANKIRILDQLLTGHSHRLAGQFGLNGLGVETNQRVDDSRTRHGFDQRSR